MTNGFIPGLLVALTVVGCSGGSDEPQAGETAPNIVQPGAPGQGTRTLTPEELENLERTEHTQADVRFMQGMIHHHAQAIRMTDLVPTHTKRRAIALIAKRIDLSQETEIEQMRTWLDARNEEAPELHRVHGHAHGTGQGQLMPGMLTEPQLKRLAAARGRLQQYVILGSGLDSYALREAGRLGDLRVFEVDDPRFLSWKQERIAEVGLTIPPRPLRPPSRARRALWHLPRTPRSSQTQS